MKEKIKEFWEERAKQHLINPAATTDDVYLRELEINTLIQTLNHLALPENGSRSLLDIGCGNGYSTLKLAKEISHMIFLGIDYSENMINSAHELLKIKPELKDRVKFIVGDATDLQKSTGGAVYDIVLSDRCLINLESYKDQSQAIAQIAEHTRAGGYFIAIENFIEGHMNMNSARSAVGLPEIPIRWHNLYFKEDEFVNIVKRFFERVTFKDFSSSYYFATRVIYSAMCHMRGEKPDYHHEIHQLAIYLPWTGQFSPIRMAVMRRK